jgi:formylglycine-generating enzyme required for sulfatase activity
MMSKESRRRTAFGSPAPMAAVALCAIALGFIAFAGCVRKSQPSAKPSPVAVLERDQGVGVIFNSSDDRIWVFVDSKPFVQVAARTKLEITSDALLTEPASNQPRSLAIVADRGDTACVIAQVRIKGFQSGGSLELHWPRIDRSLKLHQPEIATPSEAVLSAIEARLEPLKLEDQQRLLLKPPLMLAAAADAREPSVVLDSIGLALVKVDPTVTFIGTADVAWGATRRQVTITKPYWISRTEITQRQFTQVMGSNSVPTQSSETLPASGITWIQATEFCERLSRITGAKYRLPTSAEWEVACRAGSRSTYFFGDDPASLHDYAWTSLNSGAPPQVHDVALKSPNPLGLFDVYGNLREWCSDWATEDSSTAPLIDPQGPTELEADRFAKRSFMRGPEKVARGGCYTSPDMFISSVSIFSHPPDKSDPIVGFRVVLEIPDGVGTDR